MAAVVWDKVGERLYETGVDHAVLYPFQTDTHDYSKGGVAWNGLTAYNENRSGGEGSPIYADNMQYLNLVSVEKYGGTIEAYTYPDEFAECDGSASLAAGVTAFQQRRKMFGLSVRTKIGNDTEMEDHGYLLHLVYNCMATPSQKNYQTINDSPDALTMSWEFTTTPMEVAGMKPTACLTIDSTKADPEKLKTLEDLLYGASGEPKLPTPDEVKEIFAAA